MAGDVGGALRELFRGLTKAFSWSKSELRKLRNAVNIGDKMIKRYRKVTPIDKRDRMIMRYIDKFYDVLT